MVGFCVDIQMSRPSWFGTHRLICRDIKLIMWPKAAVSIGRYVFSHDSPWRNGTESPLNIPLQWHDRKIWNHLEKRYFLNILTWLLINYWDCLIFRLDFYLHLKAFMTDDQETWALRLTSKTLCTPVTFCLESKESQVSKPIPSPSTFPLISTMGSWWNCFFSLASLMSMTGFLMSSITISTILPALLAVLSQSVIRRQILSSLILGLPTWFLSAMFNSSASFPHDNVWVVRVIRGNLEEKGQENVRGIINFLILECQLIHYKARVCRRTEQEERHVLKKKPCLLNRNMWKEKINTCLQVR